MTLWRVFCGSCICMAFNLANMSMVWSKLRSGSIYTTLLLLRIDVLVDRRLLITHDGRGSDDYHSDMTGKVVRLLRQVHRPNIEACVGFDLNDTISDTRDLLF